MKAEKSAVLWADWSVYQMVPLMVEKLADGWAEQ